MSFKLEIFARLSGIGPLKLFSLSILVERQDGIKHEMDKSLQLCS
jgi:hypothetical protein